jgi:hypothetical protein
MMSSGRLVFSGALALLVALSVVAAPTGSIHTDADQDSSRVAAGPVVDYAYRNYSTIKDILIQVESEYPEIVALHDIGDSWEKTEGLADRDILAIKISDNVQVDEEEPEFLLIALQHAREWPVSETAVEAIRMIVENYGSDPRISWLVDNREIWIVPVVNPDGLDFSMSVDDDWRKNRRDNLDGTFGVDLNRNWNGSQNDDPLGEWSGVGSSDVTSSDTYCGAAPFSEPETQAVRDLVLAHDFQIAFDFHTQGEYVMWPWGYTTNLTPDDAYLVDIGEQLAALNGYVADQSVGLYPTTGDSLDWMYGGPHVFPILFEMGKGDFHPPHEADVLQIIDENMLPTLLGIELCGDRMQLPFEISHQPLQDSPYSESGFEVSADITAYRGVDTSALELHFRVDGGSWSSADMTQGGSNDTYSGLIPSQPASSVVEYYLVAHDLGGVELMSPRYSPYEMYSFSVASPSSPPVADAGDDQLVALEQVVVFDSSLSYDDVGIENWTWTFDYDGAQRVLFGPSPSFQFFIEGSYIVTLEVMDEDGQSDSDTVTIIVQETAIPEFSGLLVPLLGILCVVIFTRARRP